MPNKAKLSQYKPWGKSVSINLFDCDISLFYPDPIKKFINEVIKVVDMKAHGPCYVDCFGIGELKGYSAMQFIETSSITVHTDEPGKRCFIDIFSCKDFDSKLAAEISNKYFQAKRIKYITLTR